MSNHPPASVVITTRNRCDELRRALASAVVQEPTPEIIVIDDASADDTSDMIRRDFPSVRLVQHRTPRGYIVRRNEAARIAQAPFIVSIDDDATFSTKSVVAQALKDFDHPRIGAVAIPYMEPHKGNLLLPCAPRTSGVWLVKSFVGTSHALRRDTFLELGGYREHLIHQGEEMDYCVRMLNAGYIVRLGNSDPVMHFASPNRDLRRIDYFGARNAVIFVWENVPFPYYFAHLLATSLHVLRWSWRPKRFLLRTKAVVSGMIWGLRNYSRRSPISRAAYIQSRLLKHTVPLNLNDFTG